MFLTITMTQVEMGLTWIDQQNWAYQAHQQNIAYINQISKTVHISTKSAKLCIYQQNQQNCAYPQVEMGLTWIDHDVIEVPVEEIEVGGQRQIISFF